MGSGKCFRSCILFRSFIHSLCALQEMSGPQASSTLSLMPVSVVSLRMLIGQIMACTLGPNKNHEPSGTSFLVLQKGPSGFVGVVMV